MTPLTRFAGNSSDPQGPDRRRSPAPLPSGPRRKNPWRGPLLWTLQGWLAMFYVAAGYAKVSEPRHLLIILLGWPEKVDHSVLLVTGMLEIVLALGLLAPALSWRVFRSAAQVCAGGLLINALIMGVLHLWLRDPVLVGVNLALALFAALVMLGRRR